MTKVSVYRLAHFNAAHRLNNPKWDAEKNKRIFGKCNNENYHGHNYDLEVKVTGEIDPETGYVIDLKILNDIINEHIIEKFDHKNLNLDTSEFANLNPTAENIAIVIWQIIKAKLNDNFSVSIRLYETPRNFVEYDGN